MTVTEADIEQQAATFRDCFRVLTEEIGRAFVGQPTVVEELLLCFFCGGHALIEGAPGLGKTLLVRALSEALDLRFARVQCTPDLMPADITGTNVILETASGPRSTAFQPGPIFANVVLADEINRATPRTQSAFLEAMQERHVTVFGATHPIPAPFSVFATQNPIEMEGTYPLPEAQLDRFFFKITVRVPGIDDLTEIMLRTTGSDDARIVPRFGAEMAREMISIIRQVKIAAPVLRHALQMVRATHPEVAEAPDAVRQYVRYGASPRAAQAMVLSAKALALLDGRFHVATADLQRVARAALGHRVIRNFRAEMDGIDSTAIVDAVLAAATR